MNKTIFDDFHETWTFDVEYASQDKDLVTLPGASCVDKGEPGCGLTTVCLENNEHVLIAVPNVDLAVNKVSQYNNYNGFPDDPLLDYACRRRFLGEMLAVFEGVGKEQVEDYCQKVMNEGTPIKIMCVYDSLVKCDDVLDVVDKFFIDESDALLDLQSMKSKSKKKDDTIDVISRLYLYAQQHIAKTCFFTATMTEAEYLPAWVRELKQIKMVWTKAVQPTPMLMMRKNPFTALREEVIKPLLSEGKLTLGDRTFSKIIVAMNSVQQSLRIIKELNIPADRVTLRCGKSPRNSKITNNIYRDSYSPSALPMITFITSSGWRGSDIYDHEAMTVCVSSTSQPWYMIDLSTQLRQAIRRQRCKDNPCYDRYVLIFDQNVFSKTEEELMAEFDANYRIFSDDCSVLNRLIENGDHDVAQSLLKTMSANKFFKRYVNHITGQGWMVNENLFLSERRKVQVTRRAYSLGNNSILHISPQKPIVIDDPNLADHTGYQALLQLFRRVKRGEEVVFSEQQKLSENYHLLKTCLEVFNRLPARKETAQKKCQHIGFDDAQYAIDLLSPFVEGHRYKAEFIEKHMKAVYRRYGISESVDMNTNIKTLEYYGLELKKVKASTIHYDIIKRPEQKF